MYKKITVDSITGREVKEMNWECEIEKDYQAILKNGSEEELEDFLDKIQAKIEVTKDVLLDFYRDFYNDESNNSETCISINEKEIEFLLHREKEIKNAIINRF